MRALLLSSALVVLAACNQDAAAPPQSEAALTTVAIETADVDAFYATMRAIETASTREQRIQIGAAIDMIVQEEAVYGQSYEFSPQMIERAKLNGLGMWRVHSNLGEPEYRYMLTRILDTARWRLDGMTAGELLAFTEEKEERVRVQYEALLAQQREASTNAARQIVGLGALVVDGAPLTVSEAAARAEYGRLRALIEALDAAPSEMITDIRLVSVVPHGRGRELGYRLEATARNTLDAPIHSVSLRGTIVPTTFETEAEPWVTYASLAGPDGPLEPGNDATFTSEGDLTLDDELRAIIAEQGPLPEDPAEYAIDFAYADVSFERRPRGLDRIAERGRARTLEAQLADCDGRRAQLEAELEAARARVDAVEADEDLPAVTPGLAEAAMRACTIRDVT